MQNTETFYELGVKVNLTLNKEDEYLILHNENGCKKIDLKEMHQHKKTDQLLIDNKETAKKIFNFITKTKAFQNDKFLVSTEQTMNKLNEYGVFSRKTLEKIWDDVFSVEIHDQLLLKYKEMEKQGSVEELIVYQG